MSLFSYQKPLKNWNSSFIYFIKSKKGLVLILRGIPRLSDFNKALNTKHEMNKNKTCGFVTTIHSENFKYEILCI